MRREMHPTSNRLLSLMPDDARDSIWCDLEFTFLPLGASLVDIDALIRDAHFLLDGVAVESAPQEHGGGEFGLVGRGGMSASCLLSGSTHAPRQTTMIFAGSSYRISAQALMDAAGRCESLRLFLLRYAEFQAAAALARPITLAQRQARLILMCADRTDGDLIPLSQSLLSSVLGVPRSIVTSATRNLEAAGAIRATGGWIEIRDRNQLLQTAHDAYGAAENAYEKLVVRDNRAQRIEKPGA